MTNSDKNYEMVVGGMKVVAGTAVVGLIAYKTPILALLESFAWFVMLPVIFLGAIGVIGKGTVQTLGAAVTSEGSLGERFTEKLNKHRSDLSDDDIDRAINN